MSNALHFFVCEGGPHLVLPKSVCSEWNGFGGDYDPTARDTDYARAFAVETPIGLIPVGGQQALVLAGSPPLSGWGNFVPGAGLDIFIFEAWRSKELDQLVTDALQEIAKFELADSKLRWKLDGSGLILMFAGDQPGKAAFGEMALPQLEGTFRILQAKYQGQEGSLHLVRLQRE
jgi:hypothetical protein